MPETTPRLRIVPPSPSSPSTEAPPSTETKTTEHPIVPALVPGQIIRVSARFPEGAKKIAFSFLPPGEKQATFVLPPRGEDGLHTYTIDTANFRAGKAWWYFRSYDEDLKLRRAKAGSFIVEDIPRALLAPRQTPVFESGFDSLGVYEPDFLSSLIGLFWRRKAT